ncbi:MAG TPA: aminotransferase class III-fold pyridoxal phosphate-dependent enzyme, partial [Capillimicrobium sp.]
MTSTARSEELLARAAELIPAWTQTLSKNPTQWVQGAPRYVQRGEGAHLVDVDGNRWLDWPMALGPVILGYGDPAVDDAIRRQLDDGIIFTLAHPVEVEVAEAIVARVPGAERVRFGKSGSDANSAAIRVSRAATGREHVLVCGYHGWHDWYIGSTTRDRGVPRADAALVASFPFGDLDALDAALDAQGGDTAAVIVEPAGAAEPPPGFLKGVVERARAHGAVSVFDEIITGFRLAPGGAQERYGVVPDLATFGKALGNGMPISALAGRAEVMEVLDDVFFSGTHGGEALSLAAARTVLDRLDAAAYERLEAHGRRLGDAVAAAIADAGVGDWVSIGGAPARTVVQIREPGDPADGLVARSVVQQEMLRHGVLFNGNNFMSLAHEPADLDRTVAAYAAAFTRL